jgi:LemA protein
MSALFANATLPALPVILSGDGPGGLAIAGIIAGAVLLFVVLPLTVMYNRLVNLRQLCHESFADIDTECQRRHDLIPNLVSIVKGYATHEKELFERVTAARAAAVSSLAAGKSSRLHGDTMGSLVENERELGSLLGDVIVVAEKYPAVKADANFRQLMREVANTEDRIQAARRFFNANVREFNNRCEQFPSMMVANWFHFTPKGFFELDNPLARAGIDMRGMLNG